MQNGEIYMTIGWKENNKTLTKAIRNGGLIVNGKIMQVIKFSSKMKVKDFGNPHYA